VTERFSFITALRDRAAAGASGVEIARWLRAELGPTTTFTRFSLLLYHAFDLPREPLRALERWTGWQAGGEPDDALGDAEVEAVLTPLRSRPADFDRWSLSRTRDRLRLPLVFDRPFAVLGYLTSHSQLVLRSRVGDDLLDLELIAVTAMRVHAAYDRLELTPAGDDARRLADVPEPYDVSYEYLRLSDGTREDFVACGAVHVLHNGTPRPFDERWAAMCGTYTPPWPPAPAPALPLRTGSRFGVWMWTGDGHDLVLKSRDEPRVLVFTGVHALQVRHFFGELTVSEARGDDGLRHFVLTDGRHEGHVTCADLHVHGDA
jgi:hypothetical protein